MLRTSDLTRSDIDRILSLASSIKQNHSVGRQALTAKGKFVAFVFFSPSTRTEMSFKRALGALGGEGLNFSDVNPSPGQRRPVEPIRDLARVLDGYADLVVLRHPSASSAVEYAEYSSAPVVSAGTGVGHDAEHPTQALTDLFTIQSRLGRLDGLRALLLGELDQRSARSFALGLSRYDSPHLILCHPSEHGLGRDDVGLIQSRGGRIDVVRNYRDALPQVDIVYHAGIDPNVEYDNSFSLTALDVTMMRPDALILHPLPRRRKEIAFDVDNDRRAIYFEQSANGVPVRMAVLTEMLAANE
jgi:aspartate carbamoyltransferase